MLSSSGRWKQSVFLCVAVVLLLCLCRSVEASVGDRLPEFKECVEICKQENCGANGPATPIPLHRRLLLWTCPSECDHTCQQIISRSRAAAHPPQAVVQFHGKWPFRRLLGVQEPASVLFSLGNLFAHHRGLHQQVRARIPASYGLRPYYEVLAWVGMASWVASAVFHTRDFAATEQLDYFAAGASVLYGLYYAPIRLFRLDQLGWPALFSVFSWSSSFRSQNGAASTTSLDRRRSTLEKTAGHSTGKQWVLPLWTLACLLAYAAHVAYLKLWAWDYTYNMAANVAVGVAQNMLWSWFSIRRYRQRRRAWAATPGLVVAWVMLAMSLELLDFPPLWGVLDAHSLWHLGTIAPTVLWYNFLVKDAQDDIAANERLKA